MPSQDAIYRFGPYELRTRTHEVYKNGTKLKLRPQAFQVIEALAESAGDVVTREEFRQLLWSTETFVDFEHGLNTAIKELRGLLNDSAGEPRYIETLPKLGYRMIVPVAAVEPAFRAPSSEPADTKSPGPESEETQGQGHQSSDDVGINSIWPLRQQEQKYWSKHPPRPQNRGADPPLHRRRWGVAAAVAVIVTVGVAIYVQWSRSRARAQAPRGRAMLAVLPFENLTGDASQEYFSDGLTEEMIGQLGRLYPQRLGVIARTSVMHYKHTQEPLSQIGRELGVLYILEGSVRRDADTVRISAQLIQTKDQTHVWSRQYDRATGGLLTLQGEIAQEIADEIRLTVDDEGKRVGVTRRAPAQPGSYEAYDLYLRGRYFWNKRTADGLQQSAEYFQKAIAKDPDYAAAYAGLADTFGLMSTWQWAPQNEFMPKARAAALRALQIDESLAEAHTSLALIAESYDYDWQTAEKEFKWAIQLDPGYATAHQWYAEHLSWRGKFDEALAESERARQLDPLSLIIATDHGMILYFSRQYDRAIEQFRSVLAMDPSFSPANRIISAYLEEGRFADALFCTENVRRLDSEGAWYWSLMTYVYGRAGQQERARQALEKLEKFMRHSPSQADQRLELAAYLGLGRKEEAIGLLQKAYAEHSTTMVTLKVDPMFDPLRGDPRFQDLLRHVGLAQ